jgi:hypothetical protein
MPFDVDPSWTDMANAYFWSGPPERSLYVVRPQSEMVKSWRELWGEKRNFRSGGILQQLTCILGTTRQPTIHTGEVTITTDTLDTETPYRSNLSHRVYVVRRKGKRSAMMVLERANNQPVLLGKTRRHLVKDLGECQESVTMNNQRLTTLLFILLRFQITPMVDCR